MVKRDVSGYSTGSKILHWLIAIVVILMLCLSFFMGDVPESWMSVVYTTHKSLGITVLALMILRACWMLYCGKPKLPPTVSALEAYLSRFIQYGFYILLIAMPISGWVMSVAAKKIPSYFGLFSLPLPIEPSKPLASFMNETHEVIAWLLIAFATLHILGALKHYFWDKDKVLQSMYKG
jgi:cytochrome b561